MKAPALARGRGSNSTRWPWIHWLLAVSMMLQPLVISAQEQVRLPDLGGNREVLPPAEARSFPGEFRNFMRAQGLLIDDQIVHSYFTDMGFQLVMHSTAQSRNFHFHVLRIPGINAFAAPAGVVALNAGLVLAADSADEVAGVLAHEIAHVTQNHLVRGMEESQRVSLPLMLATLGLVMAGAAAGGMDGETATGLLMAGQGLAAQSQINYTRQNEAEADRIGIQLMARAGFDPVGMADFFNTLNRWSRSMGAGPPEYLRTHPMTVSRVAEARERAAKLSTQRHQDHRFDLVQARLRVLMAQHPGEAIEYFETRLENQPRNEAAIRYGLAMALIQARQLQRAEQQVAWLINRDQDHQLYRLQLGELRIAQGRINEGLDQFSILYDAYGQSSLVALSYAGALLRSDDSDNASLAVKILERQMRRDPEQPRISEMLARAANLAGDPVRAAEAVAANYYQRGGLPQAIEQLQRVLERDDLDYYDRARISARLDQLRVERLRTMSDRQGQQG